MLPIGGSGSHDTSVCQPSPLARGLSLSAWMIINSGWPGACGAAGWMCSSPNMPAERQVLVWAQMLVAEEDHRILGQRPVDLVEGAVAERLGQVDAADLAADDRRQFVDGDRVVGAALVGDMLDAGAVAAA